MNGMHDIAGSDGFGAIVPDRDEPLFRNDWERAAFAFFSQAFAAGIFNLDEFRYGMEVMDPVEYLTHPYYAHWMHSFEYYMLQRGFDAKELDERTDFYLKNPAAPLPATRNEGLVELVETIVAQGGTARRAEQSPAGFQVGDVVQVDSSSPFTHTRRARYIRGKVGTIELHHGAFIYPDSAATGGGESPQHVYTVRFDSEHLFGSGYGDPRSAVLVDLWEPYLTPRGEAAAGR
ncbi:nitrile hydratase subunit beta [Streptomyces tremellae]|uniref:Nitrile hydratase subunit beta n=1 Tax=Streptomyces tremellae TaxID=1124239 RepID=A0ABP7FXN3_9ACTN